MGKIKQYLITDFGAKASETQLQTEKIQECIEVCRREGGGEIVIPAGVFLIGAIRLYSNMTLRLKSGAILRGSKNFKDFYDFKIPTTIKYLYDEKYIKAWNLPSYYFYAMIVAFNEENISIIGEPGSVIDGQNTFDPDGEEKFRGPMGMTLSQIKNLHLEGYTFENSSNWSHTLDGCEDISIENVAIKAGHDGFNLHHSTNIQVKNCRLETGDDCFAGYDVENLLVEHCYLNTACNGMRIGGRNLTFKQCIFKGPGKYKHISEDTTYTHAIFKYYSVVPDIDRGDSIGIKFSNCTIHDADKLFSYEFNNIELHQNKTPLRDFTLENATISGIREKSLFKGSGEQVILSFKNVRFDTKDIKDIFLQIDNSVTLKFENVWFNVPTKIQVSDNEFLTFGGEVETFIRKVL